MSYADGQMLEELTTLRKGMMGLDNKSDLAQILVELKLLRLAVSESLDIDLEQINIDVADAKSTI